MTYDPAGVEKASRDLLVAIGEDPEREGLVGTPDRMARAWREMCKGLTEDPREHLRTQFHAGITCCPSTGAPTWATSRAAAS